MKKHRKQLIEALRSGSYKQGFGRLREECCYCVLGVCCDVSGVGEWTNYDDGHYDFRYSTLTTSDGSSMPREVRNYYGFSNEAGDYRDQEGKLTSLIELNDSKKLSFEEIADIIEEEPCGLFVSGDGSSSPLG